jgi:hypothetical protein
VFQRRAHPATKPDIRRGVRYSPTGLEQRFKQTGNSTAVPGFAFA